MAPCAQRGVAVQSSPAHSEGQYSVESCIQWGPPQIHTMEPCIELVEIGDVVSYEFLEKELAMLERLDVMITRVTRN